MRESARMEEDREKLPPGAVRRTPLKWGFGYPAKWEREERELEGRKLKAKKELSLPGERICFGSRVVALTFNL